MSKKKKKNKKKKRELVSEYITNRKLDKARRENISTAPSLIRAFFEAMDK